MKGAWITVAALAMGEGGGPARGEDASPRNAITLEPLSVVYARTIALEYERGFGRVGLHIASALTLGGFDSADSQGDYLAVGVTLGLRVYPWSEAPAGGFLGPFASVAWVDADDGAKRSQGLGWSVGAQVGWTWILGSVFALSLGAGAAWYAYDLDGAGGTAVGRSGLLPALRLAVGAAF